MSNLLERALAFHSAPAICGIKASNLVSINYSDTVVSEIEELNKKYPNFGFYILRCDGEKVLVLIYRKYRLKNELFKEDNIKFLSDLGYDTSSLDSLLYCLKERMNYSEFPHEIGVFLGYDLEDIKSFINKDICLYVGYWKVYSNVEEKKKIFNKYTRCKNCVMNLVNKGFPIENFMR